MTDRHLSTAFKHSTDDVETVRHVPRTPQTQSPAYRLAFADQDFMLSEDARGVRFELEYLKAELVLREREIASTVVLFGSSRIPPLGAAAALAATASAKASLEKKSVYYDQARRFARLASLTARSLDYREFVVVTGGGPGVMEAGNRGATELGAPSIGFNIVLPHEQTPNGFIDPELCFNFHYFHTRKFHLLQRAKAVAFFPGGFGTMDELFETLTLIQTGRVRRIPILLFGSDFWNRVVNFEALAEEGTISPNDRDLFARVETAAEGWEVVRRFYDLPEIADEIVQ
jgi:uncharacterized protein (TIGR00730 family)